MHVSGGNETLVPFPDTKGFACDEVMVQLFQVAPKAETEIGKPIFLKGDSCDYVTIPLPAVHDRTVFRILFSAANSNSGRFRQNPVLNEQLLAAYPADLFSSLKNWSETASIVVIDPLRKLMPILDEHKIKYATTLPAQKNAPVDVCIWAPVAEGAEGLPFSCRSTVVLHERSQDLPSIVKNMEAGRLRIDVNMRLLDLLHENPLVQQTFISLVIGAAQGE